MVRIAISVHVQPGPSGGTAPAVRSLLSALGALTDGPEEYTIVVRTDEQIEWLSPLGPNQKFAIPPAPPATPPLRRALAPIAQRARNWLVKPRVWPEVPVSDGYYESLNCDIIHFPTQEFTVCALPSVYNPHDLQHLHYPQFFTPAELAWRETVYPAACHFAKTVIVNSQWVKDDVVQQYGVSPTKVQVIPEASPNHFKPQASANDGNRIKERYGLQDGFAFYPSMTWPHKNHMRLFEALAYLRDHRGLVVPLVCTGSRHERSWPQIEARLTELGLTDQVYFLGFVSPEDLQALYRRALCLILPTLFEANSLPIFEAWFAGVPVACSNITALPEQVMDAGLLFDPLDSVAIADSLARLATDERLRRDLRAKGRRRLDDFDWTRTAKAYRAVYRRAAGQRPTEEDRMLLEWDWMRNPRPVIER
jgi:glycosyltransferase involved in cell wall biosynthesis